MKTMRGSLALAVILSGLGGATLAGPEARTSPSPTPRGSVLGNLSGTITESATGNLIANQGSVLLFDSGGTQVASQSTDAAGVYQFTGVTAGTYFVATSFASYSDELYDNFPCEGGCDPTVGTPVAVSAGSTTSGIDFALDGPVPVELQGFSIE